MDVQEYGATMQAVDAAAPSGVWSGAPSLAATGVKMTNTSGYPVIVNISGGTLTTPSAVTINGTLVTASGAGRYRLRRGGTIAIGYSVAPTVQWLYE